ncbi:Brr6/Brl1 family protein [Sporobolomyces koalae]|uniref:Brr6/Brl1 family protein n=1 Tax=Sporobolomyces koalae TaxID=500713 RepID=UPI003175C45A
MRRFPAPPPVPGTPAAANNARKDRSVEAPMQYEWEKPRHFPTSPFQPLDDQGERARKRTHYEAMDVDTPPRPVSNATPNTHTTTTGSNTVLEPLSFDPKGFDRKQALGFDQNEIQEVVMADTAEELVNRPPHPPQQSNDLDDDDLALVTSTGGARRRNQHKRRPVTIETDDEDDDDTEEHADDRQDSNGFLGTLQKRVGKRAAGGEFSFQVHHHHAPLGSNAGGPGSGNPERWLQSNTPYVLLGYLQFGSLTLMAVLVLSLLVLFLWTLYTDIQSRLSSLTLELRSEILQCARAYVDNRCEPATRIPAMERKCNEWEECMNQEIVVTGKTRVVAETLAEIVNGFVDVISFKTMLFVLLSLGITIYGSSAALSLLSARASSHAGPTPPPYYPPPMHHPYGATGPAGLPYNAGQTPWVIENGNDPSRLGLIGGSGGDNLKRRNS